MKTKILAIGFFLMGAIGATAAESNTIDPSARALELINRTQEIRTMELKELSDEDRAELKSEVKAIRTELKELKSTKGLDSPLTISVGAAIIILLVLIIIL